MPLYGSEQSAHFVQEEHPHEAVRIVLDRAWRAALWPAAGTPTARHPRRGPAGAMDTGELVSKETQPVADAVDPAQDGEQRPERIALVLGVS